MAEAIETADFRQPRPKLDSGIALLLVGAALLVYVLTLCPTIYSGDDGDLITAIVTFGVPHPTGYPLFCLMGRLFLALDPWGSPALRINLMTAFFGAASIGFLYRFLAVILAPRGHRYLAATGALLFAFSPTMWQQSLSCEVYSLTALFLTLLLYLAARWQQEPGSDRKLLLLTFVFGLALTNHLTVALLFPAFLGFVVYHRPGLLGRGWRLLPPMATLFLLPLILYAYLPLAAHNSAAPVNWGLTNTLQAFWEHVTGDAFRSSMFQSSEVALRQGTEYLGYLQEEFGLPLLLLVPFGVALLWRGVPAGPGQRVPVGQPRQTRALCCLLMAVWLITVLYAINYDIFDIYAYYIPSYMVVSCLIALGMSAVLTAVQDARAVSDSERARVAPLIALVALMIPLVPMSVHYEASSKSGNYLEDDFAHNIARSCPRDALVITSSNVIFSLWYQRFVLKERSDLVPVHQGLTLGLLSWNAWYARHLNRMQPDLVPAHPDAPLLVSNDIPMGRYLVAMMRRAAQRGTPVMIVPDPRFDGRAQQLHAARGTFRTPFDDQVAAAGMIRVPWGVCERVYLKGQEPAPASVIAENLALHPRFRFRGIYDHTWSFADPMQRHIPRRYLDADENFARLAEQSGQYAVAIEALDRALRLNDLPELREARARCVAAQQIKPVTQK